MGRPGLPAQPGAAMTAPGSWVERPERPAVEPADPLLDLRLELIDNPGRTWRIDRGEALELANVVDPYARSVTAVLLGRFEGRLRDRNRNRLPFASGRFDGFDDLEGRVCLWYEAPEGAPPEEKGWWKRLTDWIVAGPTGGQWFRQVHASSFSPAQPARLPDCPTPPPLLRATIRRPSRRPSAPKVQRPVRRGRGFRWSSSAPGCRPSSSLESPGLSYRAHSSRSSSTTFGRSPSACRP